MIKKVEFHSSFSRHGRADASIALLIWLNEKVVFLLLLALLSPSAAVLAQQGHRSKARISMTFQGETLSEALRRIDLAQNEKNILFLFDDLELYTVSVTIDRLPVADAVRRVCDALPVSVTEEGDNIFVEYVPKIVRLNPVVVDGERVAIPPFLLVDSLSDDISRLQQYARHIVYFNHVCPQEKVYLHLDNTAYFQGETIWFAANVVSAIAGGKAASKVLYVELLSPTGVVLKQQKLRVVDGRCHGSFPLVDAGVEAAVALRGVVPYPSGYYQIRAYTRAQLNFDEAGIFSRVIPVYRTPEQEGHYDNPVIANYDGLERERPDLPRSEKPGDVNVTFYPEGGHLIEGVPCRIAFKVTDENGMGLDVDAVCDADDHVIPTTPLHKGMGAFVRVPGKGTERLSFIKDGRKHTFALPKAEQKGCTVCFGAPDKDVLSVAVEGMNMDGARLLGYTITSNGRVMAGDTVALTADAQPQHSRAQLSIPKKGLPTGVCQFTLFDPDGAIYAQRLFFVDNGIPTIPVTVARDKADLHPFDSVSLRLHTDVPTTFSLAVRDAADYGTAYRDDIRTYMLLSSELKGLIEEPGWYCEESLPLTPPKGGENRGIQQVTPPSGGDGGRLQALDLLMMVQGWTRYNWRQMAGVEPFKIRHYTEKQLVVDGWAFSRIKETPLPGVKMAVRLTSLDRKHRQNATVTTDSLGYWSVGVEDFEGEWDLYMETRQKGDKKGDKTTRVRLERASKPALYAYTPLETWLPEYTWDAAGMLTVEKAGDSEYQLPSDSHLLDEVEVKGQRKYIDYNTFKAFDAAKDAELILDEGNYTYKVVDYLRDKGYDVTFPVGETFDSFISRYTHEDWLSCPPLEEINGPDSMVSRTIYYQWISIQSLINGVRTFWFIKDGKRDLTGPSFFDGFDLDLEEVKSILVYDDRNSFSSFPAIRDLFTNRLIRKFERPHNYLGLPAGLYIVEIELNPSRKRRTYVDKNARSTSFSGYTPVVEFYAPTYPNGPIQGDKDYRRTIYWNPEVATDAEGHATVSFYNNGYSRALTISAEGLTPDGVPIINLK